MAVATRTLTDRLGAPAALLMMGWLSVVLWLDRADGGGSIWVQRCLGLLTWCVLLVALSRVSPTVRAQTAVVVAFATVVEVVFSATLHVYEYRFDNVPAYVPPGHGLVYLSAFALGHAAFVRRPWSLRAGATRRPDGMRVAEVLVLAAGAGWAAYGLFVADRPDALGAFWYLCLVGFLLWGPSKPVYVGAFVVVSWLELLGTGLGTWVWGAHDFTGRVTIGNPPSGAAGGYGWFDLAGLLAAPWLLRGWGRVTAAPGRRGAPPPGGAGR